MYWREHPPVHVSLHALLKGLAGRSSGRSAPPAPPTAGEGGSSAMEGVAAFLGPPDRKFVPPCRMEPAPASQAPAMEP